MGHKTTYDGAMDVIREAKAEAEERYRGPRMHHGTVVDREVAAFVAGAGWAETERRPRAVSTVAELDALPVGSVVLEADTGPFLGIPTIPGVFHRFPRAVWGESDGWFVVAGRGGRKNAEIALPARVLWTPEVGA